MERARWSAYLRDPYHLEQHGEDPVGSIEALRERFPFCRVLYLLECRALKEKDHLEWKEKAREWSILVPDRKKLFQLLAHEPPPSSSEGANQGAKVAEGPEENSTGTQAPAPSPEKEPDPTPMEQEILSEAVNQRILYDPEKALLEESTEEESPPQEEEKKEEHSHKNGEKESERVEEKEPEEATPSNRRFTEWLDPQTSPEEGKARKSEDASEEDLIEAFIEEGEEQSSPPKEQKESPFFSSERMARRSTDESELPVSETLAELYVQQGDIKRAIQAFEKLRLNIPEKSDYFAGRIQELKDRSKR